MNVLDQFYDYQLEAFEAVSAASKGIVCMPTGTGKTFVQAGIVADDIVKNPGFRVYVVNAPRIMLSFQLMREVQKFLLNNGIDARYLAVHSGSVQDSEEILAIQQEQGIGHRGIDSTTSSKVVAEHVNTSLINDQPLVIFSTYHSSERIAIAMKSVVEPINIVLNDEAHFLVEERFFPLLDTLPAERMYFFTATTRETPSANGRGMNNVASYGLRLYEMTPREAIARGKMVRPRQQWITLNDTITDDDADRSIGKIVRQSFLQHQRTLKGTIKPKMLVAAAGSSQMRAILDSSEIKKLIKSGVDVFAVASDPAVGNSLNGAQLNGRAHFLNKLKEYGADPERRMVILHYDILSEGVDVPGITGVMFMRAMLQSKFLQNLGRATRLDPGDRSRLEDGTLDPDDIKNFVKPYAYVIVPMLTHGDKDQAAQFSQIIEAMREFGFKSTEMVRLDQDGRAVAELEGEEAMRAIITQGPQLGIPFENLRSLLEDERKAGLGFEDSELILSLTLKKIKGELSDEKKMVILPRAVGYCEAIRNKYDYDLPSLTELETQFESYKGDYTFDNDVAAGVLACVLHSKHPRDIAITTDNRFVAMNAKNLGFTVRNP